MVLRHGLQIHWKANVFARLLCENMDVYMKLVAKGMETIGVTNVLQNFHGFWNYGLRDVRVKKIMENISAKQMFSMKLVAKVMGNIGKTNGFQHLHDFWNYGRRAVRAHNTKKT